MKALLDCPVPFSLTHGGAQVQIEQTKAGLEAAGVEVEFLRWWDGRQRGDLIHSFAGASNTQIHLAGVMKLPVIITPFFTEPCNRSDAQLLRQGWLIRTILAAPFGERIKQQLTWRAYINCAHHVVGLEAERRVLQIVYRVPASRVSVVPLGLSEAYLNAGPGRRIESHLICTGTITQRKNCVALAKMARAAQVPILFVGKPYHPGDPYWLQFKALMDNCWVKYHPHVNSEAEMIELLRAARGLVLMSQFENWCLSAHEAVACGLPLLLQDQKWSRERFGNQARYFERIGVSGRNIDILKEFHSAAPGLSAPAIALASWAEVGRQLRAVYERVLSTSR